MSQELIEVPAIFVQDFDKGQAQAYQQQQQQQQQQQDTQPEYNSTLSEEIFNFDFSSFLDHQQDQSLAPLEIPPLLNINQNASPITPPSTSPSDGAYEVPLPDSAQPGYDYFGPGQESPTSWAPWMHEARESTITQASHSDAGDDADAHSFYSSGSHPSPLLLAVNSASVTSSPAHSPVPPSPGMHDFTTTFDSMEVGSGSPRDGLLLGAALANGNGNGSGSNSIPGSPSLLPPSLGRSASFSGHTRARSFDGQFLETPAVTHRGHHRATGSMDSTHSHYLGADMGLGAGRGRLRSRSSTAPSRRLSLSPYPAPRPLSPNMQASAQGQLHGTHRRQDSVPFLQLSPEGGDVQPLPEPTLSSSPGSLGININLGASSHSHSQQAHSALGLNGGLNRHTTFPINIPAPGNARGMHGHSLSVDTGLAFAQSGSPNTGGVGYLSPGSPSPGSLGAHSPLASSPESTSAPGSPGPWGMLPYALPPSPSPTHSHSHSHSLHSSPHHSHPHSSHSHTPSPSHSPSALAAPAGLPTLSAIAKPVVTTHKTRLASETKRKHPQKFACSLCNGMFTTKNKRDRHVDAHQGIKRFKCGRPGCTKAFTSSADRKRHMENTKHP